jgi:hypothetical protein
MSTEGVGKRRAQQRLVTRADGLNERLNLVVVVAAAQKRKRVVVVQLFAVELRFGLGVRDRFAVEGAVQRPFVEI